MTLEDLITKLPEIEELRNIYLVFDSTTNTALLDIQDNYFSNSQNKIAPLLLNDGRYILCADILTETTNGIYSGGFSMFPTEYYNLVTVVPLNEILQLLPINDGV